MTYTYAGPAPLNTSITGEPDRTMTYPTSPYTYYFERQVPAVRAIAAGLVQLTSGHDNIIDTTCENCGHYTFCRPHLRTDHTEYRNLCYPCITRHHYTGPRRTSDQYTADILAEHAAREQRQLDAIAALALLEARA